MKKGSTLFLKAVIVLIAIAILGGLLGFPHLEGRNEGATWFQIYFNDPFLAYIYLTAVPFYWALFQGFKLLQNIDKSIAFSLSSIKALKHIKISALIHSLLFSGAMYSIYQFAEDDDSPGVIVLGMGIVGASLVVSTFAAILEKLVQNAVDMKSENDLTV